MMKPRFAVLFGLLAMLPGVAPAATAEQGREGAIPMTEPGEHIGNSYNAKIVVSWIPKKGAFRPGAAPLTGGFRMVNRGDKPLKINPGELIIIRLKAQDGTTVQSEN